MSRPRSIPAQLRAGYRRAGSGWRSVGRSLAVFDPICRHVLAPLPARRVSPRTPPRDLHHALEPMVEPRVCLWCELVPLRPGGAER